MKCFQKPANRIVESFMHTFGLKQSSFAKRPLNIDDNSGPLMDPVLVWLLHGTLKCRRHHSRSPCWAAVLAARTWV